MANEAIVRQGADADIEYWTVADANAITKGQLMVMDITATRTAKAHSSANDLNAIGFAAEDKEASDGVTRLAIQCHGLVRARAGGTIDEGDHLIPGSTANQIITITGTLSEGLLKQIVGRAFSNGASGGLVDVMLGLRL